MEKLSCLISIQFQIYNEKSYKDGWWRWLHNNVNVFSTTELNAYKLLIW